MISWFICLHISHYIYQNMANKNKWLKQHLTHTYRITNAPHSHSEPKHNPFTCARWHIPTLNRKHWPSQAGDIIHMYAELSLSRRAHSLARLRICCSVADVAGRYACQSIMRLAVIRRADTPTHCDIEWMTCRRQRLMQTVLESGYGDATCPATACS